MSVPNKHTPGPWDAFTSESFSGWWSVRGRDNREIGSGDGGFDEGDARLIAAAPELLEALEMVTRRGRIDDSEEAMNQVAAAIAKAKKDQSHE